MEWKKKKKETKETGKPVAMCKQVSADLLRQAINLPRFSTC